MGAATEEEVEEFAQAVFNAEELFNEWRFRWTSAKPGVCVLKTKTIFIPQTIIGDYPWQAKEYVLHEMAHIRTLDKERGHGPVFYQEYARLVLRHMVTEPK
jgi:predicted metal-dependent hydrolase